MQTNQTDRLLRIITERRPEMAGLPARLFEQGFDSVAIAVGDRLFKFPRHADGEAALRREAALLSVIRPRISMVVPDLILHEAPRLYSEHPIISGEHLTSEVYAKLPNADREVLANDLARFYAQLHALDQRALRDAGARQIGQWNGTDQIKREALPLLPERWWDEAAQLLDDYAAMPADPLGQTYGFFDGHGWNMAFDAEAGRLKGVYDFADSGFGPLHREFIYSDFISRDLTRRIVEAYERLRGLKLDRRRIDATMGVLLLDELAGAGENPSRAEEITTIVHRWFADRVSDDGENHPDAF